MASYEQDYKRVKKRVKKGEGGVSIGEDSTARYRLENKTPLYPFFWWREKDLNLRRIAPADLQSAAIDHSAIPPKKLYSKIISWI